MTYSVSNNCTKICYNRTLTVQVIIEDVVTWIFLKHSVYIATKFGTIIHCDMKGLFRGLPSSNPLEKVTRLKPRGELRVRAAEVRLTASCL